MDSIIHFEIPADNVTRAQNFYKNCFSWNIVDVPEMDYTIVHTGPTDKQGMPQESAFINGGMFKRNKPIESVVITINVKNIDETMKKIERLGGKMIKQKFKVEDMGYAAYFKDTEGNIIGLWENTKKM